MSLAHFLDKELLAAEKSRVEIFIFIMIATLLITVTIQFFFFEVISETFTNPASFPVLIVFSLLMIIVLAISRKMILYQKKHLGRLSKRYLWYSMCIEVLFPSGWLIIGSKMEQTAALLDSPIIFIYFMMLLVSALHMNFKFSIGLGLMIGAFYGAFTYWVTSTYPTAFNLPKVIYFIRADLFLLCGVVAGFVAREMKRRLVTSYEHLEQRDNIEKLFSQQVSQEVVDALKSKQDFSSRMQVTVMFLDIRDFTKRVQHLNPEEVIEFQNQFFSPVIEIINNQKGVTNQIMGDGLMATFGAPITNEEHARKGLQAAFEIFEFLKTFNLNNPLDDFLELGVGMHTGEVIVGNIGTQARKQFSVSGTAVIIAARLEQLNKELKSNMLISMDLYQTCSELVANKESMGRRKLKGIDQEIEIIKVL